MSSFLKDVMIDLFLFKVILKERGDVGTCGSKQIGGLGMKKGYFWFLFILREEKKAKMFGSFYKRGKNKDFWHRNIHRGRVSVVWLMAFDVNGYRWQKKTITIWFCKHVNIIARSVAQKRNIRLKPYCQARELTVCWKPLGRPEKNELGSKRRHILLWIF